MVSSQDCDRVCGSGGFCVAVCVWAGDFASAGGGGGGREWVGEGKVDEQKSYIEGISNVPNPDRTDLFAYTF